MTGNLNKAKKEYTDLVLSPVLTPSRRKAIKTLMKRKNLSYSDAKRYQAEKIIESSYGIKDINRKLNAGGVYKRTKEHRN